MQRLILMVLFWRSALAVGPVFTTPDPDATKDAHKIYMSEFLKGGDVVITLGATDADSPDGSLIFSMNTSPLATTSLFEIVGANLLVKAAVAVGTFDYEKAGAVREYDIILKVSDGTTVITLVTKIYIRDENDNTPDFLGTAPYMGNVLESVAGGTSVYKMEATDADGSFVNSKITYGLTGTTQFVIDSNTGVISTAANAVFDLATKSQYQMTITATDGGVSPKADAETLTLMIFAAPKFDNLFANRAVNINENVPADTAVYTLLVSDKSTPTGNLFISIKTQSPSSPQMFKLDGNVLRTNTNGLDAETTRIYTFTFRVADGIYTTDSATLTVNINDLNDNTPTITPVGLVNIEENQLVGPANGIVDINAADGDVSDPNNKLSYFIIFGNPLSIFGMDSTTGLIYLAKTPQSMSVSQHVLKVRVSDGASPSRSATVDVTVNINPNTVNECSFNPCRNGAPCTSFVNDYTCACAVGYEGKNCETNINDCTQTSCQNGATCVDGLNTFMCNCAAGYTGSTCTQVCTNGKYGSGCLQTCNCDASRLIEGVGTQTCNYVTGACKCNSKWTGSDCQTDANECSSATICSAVTNKVCENTIGSYYCTCKTGYTERTDSSCQISSTTPTLTAGANELRIVVRMNLDKTCINRDIPSVYAAEKQALEQMLNSILRPVKRSLVYNIICGPETFDSVIIIDNTETAKANLANDLQSLRDGKTLNVDGVNTKVTTMTVDGKILISTTSGDTGSKVCTVYTAYVTCPSGEECRYKDGTASCRSTDEDNDDDLELLLGLTLGLLLPLILGVIIGGIFCYMRYQQKLRYGNRSYSRRDKYGRDNWRDDDRHSYDQPRRYYGDSNISDKRDYYGLSPLENNYYRY